MDIAVGVYQLTENFPSSEKFGLTSQLKRSAVSIASNIAEGSSRISAKDYRRFIEIALGSSYELETQLLICKMVGYPNGDLLSNILNNVIEEQRMLSAFIKIIKED